MSSSAAGAASAQDGVSISDAARHASEVSRLVQLATGSAQVRAEKVEAARQSLERGDYKNPEVVAKVAEKIAKYLG